MEKDEEEHKEEKKVDYSRRNKVTYRRCGKKRAREVVGIL